jgi:hypothetical protein
LIYIGRADLDNADIEDLIDGKGKKMIKIKFFFEVSCSDEENLFAWRLYDRIQNKTYLFTHRTSLDKIQMMDALEYERAYVEENLSKGLEIPLYTRLRTFKTQQYLADQSSTSFPSITKQSKTRRKKTRFAFFLIIFIFRSFYFSYSSNEYFTV